MDIGSELSLERFYYGTKLFGRGLIKLFGLTTMLTYYSFIYSSNFVASQVKNLKEWRQKKIDSKKIKSKYISA